jgi:hypothetical protein
MSVQCSSGQLPPQKKTATDKRTVSQAHLQHYYKLALNPVLQTCSSSTPTWPNAGFWSIPLHAGKQDVVVVICVKPGLICVVNVYAFAHGCAEGHLQLPRGCVGHACTCAVAVVHVKVQQSHTLDASVPAGAAAATQIEGGRSQQGGHRQAAGGRLSAPEQENGL